MFRFFFRKSRPKNITPQKAKERLSSGDRVFLLDVRTPEEYREIHIPRSISLPLDKLEAGISKVTEKKDSEIIVCCLTGIRAARACRRLASMGYSNVVNMGGIQSWHYETERGGNL